MQGHPRSDGGGGRPRGRGGSRPRRLHSPTTRRTLPPGRAKMRKAEHEEFMVEVMELLERLNCPAYLWNDVVFIASTYLLELIT